MPRKMVGERIGKIKILGKFSPPGKTYKKYRCHCLNCGKEFEAYAASIRKNKDFGCFECTKKVKIAKHIEELELEYKGKVFGSLKIEGFGYDGKDYRAICTCLSCGRETVTSWHGVKKGDIKSCKCGLRKSATRGTLSKGFGDGTSIISHHRALNSNSTTGVKGVTWNPRNKFRATIGYKGEKIYLGSFDTLEDAAEARRKAEEMIYGDFEEWFQSEYPDRYKILKDKGII